MKMQDPRISVKGSAGLKGYRLHGARAYQFAIDTLIYCRNAKWPLGVAFEAGIWASNHAGERMMASGRAKGSTTFE
jgi:hypothetical protein